MPNMIVAQHFDHLKRTVNLRVELLNALTDADLAYKLPGVNPTLGELLKELGEMMVNYNESFKTFTLDYSYHHSDEVCDSIEKLKAWFAELDHELYVALESLTDEQITHQNVQRPLFGEVFSTFVHYHTLREGFLIYYGKLSCYLKGMDKPLPAQMQSWIG